MTATLTRITARERAVAFIAEADALGFRVSAKPGIVTIRKSFTPGDRDAYVACDGDGPGLLGSVPVTSPGSQWGSDGGSIGGALGLRSGYYRLSQSGVSKRFTTALNDLGAK